MVQADGEWKKKYFDGLAELERREKHWQSIESTLRRCISRLSFVGDGMDPQLDARLEQLRNRVRGEQDIRALLRLVEDIAGRAEGVQGKQVSGVASVSPDTSLISQLLDEATLPRLLAKRAQKISRELLRSPVPAGTAQAAKALILEALAEQPAPDGSPGLIGKLFSRQKDAAVGADSKPEPAEAPPAAGSPDGQRLFVSLVDQLASADLRAVEMHQLADQAGRASTPRALDVLVSDLVKLLADSAEETSPPVDSLPPADRVLLQLVQGMDISPELQPRIQALKTRLSGGVVEADIPSILTELLQLSEHARVKAEQERREVERFLLQMTEQLQRLDQEVNSIGSAGSQLADGQRRLDSEMESQVSHLHASVQQATDLDELKVTIAERLNLIQDRLRGHKSETEQLVQDFEQRIDLLTTRLGDMEQETASLREHVEQARIEAFTDALTGLNNRHAFDCRLEEEFSRWNRYGYPLSMIVVDVDHFKKVNDTYGHLAGDKVLHVIGAHLKRVTRKADFAARYGGEEFVILLPEVDMADAKIVA